MRLSGHVPDLPALEVLLTVARTGSLNSAARELGVSQQAVSSRIRAIEAQTGVPLVSRTPRGSSLTAEGVVVAEWAARLLDVAAELDAGISALRQDRHSRLRVSASLDGGRGAAARLPGGVPRRGGPAAGPAGRRDRADRRQQRRGAGPGQRRPGRSRVRRGAARAPLAAQQDRRARPAGAWSCRPPIRGPAAATVTAAELAATPLVSREEGSGTRDVLAAALARAPGAGRGPGPGRAVAVHHLGHPGRRAGRRGPGRAQPTCRSATTWPPGGWSRSGCTGLDLRRPLRVVWRGVGQPAGRGGTGPDRAHPDATSRGALGLRLAGTPALGLGYRLRSTMTGAWSLGPLPLRASRSTQASDTAPASAAFAYTRSMRMPMPLWNEPAR